MEVYNILGIGRGGMGRRDYTTSGTKSDVGNNIDYTTIRVLKLEFLTKYRMSYKQEGRYVA